VGSGYKRNLCRGRITSQFDLLTLSNPFSPRWQAFLSFEIATISIWFGDYFESFDLRSFIMVTTSFQNSSTTSHIVSSRNCMNRSISLAAVSLAFMLASNTFAAITQPQRITKTTLTGTNGTFSEAHYGYENLLSVQASTVGDLQTEFFSYKSNFQNVAASVIARDTTLNFAAPAYVPADGLYESPYTLTFGGSNLHSTWRFAYDGGAVSGATPGDNSFISQTQVVRNGQLHAALVFHGGGSGGVSAGGTFNSTVVMAGLWGASGTGNAGSVEYSYNSAYYNIQSNFYFDGVNTTFTVGTNAYVTTPDGEGNNPTIQMMLIGDVVIPAPGAAALIGLAGLVVGRRRRN